MTKTGLRFITYNIHKCIGLDRRVRPERIVEVLAELDADVVALQEVVSIEGKSRRDHQASYIASELGMNYCMGETRKHRGGAYGNVLMSRVELRNVANYDLSIPGRERRGCLRADLDLNGSGLLHLFNVHLGTAYLERRKQARRLIDRTILSNAELKGRRIVLGDFNEWTRGLTTKLLRSELNTVEVRAHLNRSKTYPGVLPILHLDHIYFDEGVELESLALCRSRKALVASDHLPLVADLTFGRSSDRSVVSRNN